MFVLGGSAHNRGFLPAGPIYRHSAQSGACWRCSGRECASGNVHAAFQRCASRPGERRHRTTPVLAMLHSLASVASTREVWWLYGARNRTQHPFERESCELLEALVRGQGHIVYSKPEPEDQLGVDYDSAGHLDVPLIDRLGLARNADSCLCGPPTFLAASLRASKHGASIQIEFTRRSSGRRSRLHLVSHPRPGLQRTLPRELQVPDCRFRSLEAV